MSPHALLAKAAVEAAISQHHLLSVEEATKLLSQQGVKLPPKLLRERSGTFVTIERKGELRGCIGTYLPLRRMIAEEIIANAVAAATKDYRFPPIQEDKLPSLSYTVYLLGEPELVGDLAELDPQKYGIIVRTAPISAPSGTDVVFDGHLPYYKVTRFLSVAQGSYKSGLLLPGLTGVSTVEEQIAIACQKGGIDPHREKIILYRFTTRRFS